MIIYDKNDVVWCDVTWYDMAWYHMIRCNKIRHNMTAYDMMKYGIFLVGQRCCQRVTSIIMTSMIMAYRIANAMFKWQVQ